MMLMWIVITGEMEEEGEEVEKEKEEHDVNE